MAGDEGSGIYGNFVAALWQFRDMDAICSKTAVSYRITCIKAGRGEEKNEQFYPKCQEQIAGRAAAKRLVTQVCG
jgi:hypothetical protein